MKKTRLLLVISCMAALAACKEPLAIEGEGDIVEIKRGERGCALEEFRAGWTRCTDNEILGTETVVYRALPRPGWTFSNWEGPCDPAYKGKDCRRKHDKTWVQWWDTNYPDEDLDPLTAVFVPDSDATPAVPYVAASFGALGRVGYAELLDALFSADGNYRFTSQQASTRTYFDRTPTSFKRQKNGLLLTGQSADQLAPGGAATAAGDFITLADTDASDGDISVTYLTAEQTRATPGLFKGTYFCGHILSNGQALYFRATMDGKGGGAMAVIARRLAGANQAAISYEVSEDGTTIFEYAGTRFAGGLSADGSVFAATQVAARLQGAGMCVRTSGNKMVANVAGSYYGAWMSTQPVTGLTELLLDQRGQTAETVLVDSTGGRNYSLGQNFMLVKGTGQIDTRDANGAVSPDGRVMFIVQTDPNKFPTLIVYIRKT